MNTAVKDIESFLSRTPNLLKIMIESLPEEMLFGTEGENTWRPYDVIGHLIHGERTDWIPRVRRIIESGESKAFDPFDRTAMFQESKGKPVPELLQEFSDLRAKSVESLRSMKLTEEDLKRKGMHPSLGTVTMGQLLATWVTHDLDHLAQIIRVSAKQYDQAVGPWKQYLSVLTR